MTSASVLPPANHRFRRLVRRAAWRISRVAALTYVVIFILGCSMQEKLIFPGASTQGTAEAQVTPPPGATLVPLTTVGSQKTVALFGPALLPNGNPHPHPESCPTLLYFYGNGMYLAATEWEFANFRRLGANMLAVEYLGYGMASGKPSEAGCYAAADAAYAWLLTQPNIDKTKIILAGWSLGGAVACDLAARHMADGPQGTPTVAGLVMFSSFTSMDDVAHYHYWFLPTTLILAHHFRTLDKIPAIRVPILLAHGTNDSLVPFSMSKTLKNAATKAKNVQYLPISGANHNDFYLIGEAQILPALQKLIEQTASTPALSASSPALKK